MITKDELRKQMNEEELLKFSRYAGGHDDHMENLIKNAEVIAHWNEGDYQGQVATCIKLKSGEYIIYNDYYGSCGGCDAWEDATDEQIISMCHDLIYDSLIFETLEEVIAYLEKDKFDKWSWNESSKHLLNEIRKKTERSGEE